MNMEIKMNINESYVFNNQHIQKFLSSINREEMKDKIISFNYSTIAKISECNTKITIIEKDSNIYKLIEKFSLDFDKAKQLYDSSSHILVNISISNSFKLLPHYEFGQTFLYTH